MFGARQSQVGPTISIARALGRQAIQDGQAQVGDEYSLNHELQANIWEPVYVPYERKP